MNETSIRIGGLLEGRYIDCVMFLSAEIRDNYSQACGGGCKKRSGTCLCVMWADYSPQNNWEDSKFHQQRGDLKTRIRFINKT